MGTNVDLRKIKTYSLYDRKSKVSLDNQGKPNPEADISSFLDSLPCSGKARDLLDLADAIIEARLNDMPVILMMGAHPVKCGLSPFISSLIAESWVTHLALNGAGVIHDVEMALSGNTSEDVAEALKDGSFGMARETGEFIMDAIGDGSGGFGLPVGDAVLAMEDAKMQGILAACSMWNIGCSVHVALGTDIIHVHPSFNPEAAARASYEDFRSFVAVISGLCDGGVVINLGSAVLLPEVFLKALSAARNLGFPVKGFTTVNMDQLMHYRPLVNVVQRPVMEGGRGISLVGHHEIMLPLLYSTIMTRARSSVSGSRTRKKGRD